MNGDEAKLRRLLARIEAAASGSLMRHVREAYAAKVREQLKRAFVEGRSPSGERWAPLASRTGSALVETGALRDSFAVTDAANGVRVTNGNSYAKAHQHGFRIRRRHRGAKQRGRRFGGRARVPARPMVPTSHWGNRETHELRVAASRIVVRFFRS